MTQATLPLADELSAVFARMSGLLLTDETVQTALQLITASAASVLPSAMGAGVTLIDDCGGKLSWAATDPVVERADALQYELDEGPCLEAIATRSMVRVGQILADRRYPQWAKAVRDLGLGSALSTPLIAGGSALGAIKVYSLRLGSFGESSQELLRLFADQAAILVANIQAVENAQRVTDELKEALASRDVISTAKGILMAREGLDSDAAFSQLVRDSQRDQKKLREVAHAVVEATSRPNL